MDSTVARKFLKGALSVAAETIWPTRCAVCESSGEDVLCDSCKHSLQYIDMCLACPKCGAPYGYIQCTECNDTALGNSGLNGLPLQAKPRSGLSGKSYNLRERLPYNYMVHALIADDAVKSIVRIYKDHDERRLATEIALILARYVSPDRIREGCALTYVPATKAAIRRRGFDHAQEICRILAKTLNLECADLFKRPRSTDQRSLGRKERAANMDSVLHLKESANVPENVIIVDDVCTTGATVTSAAFALKDAGAANVYALTFGKVLD